jgi:hypothetical protein
VVIGAHKRERELLGEIRCEISERHEELSGPLVYHQINARRVALPRQSVVNGAAGVVAFDGEQPFAVLAFSSSLRDAFSLAASAVLRCISLTL